MGADHQRVARVYGHDGRGRGREELGDGFWDWLKMMTSQSTPCMWSRAVWTRSTGLHFLLVRCGRALTAHHLPCP